MIYELDGFFSRPNVFLLLCSFLRFTRHREQKNVIMNTHNKHKKPEERFPIFMTQQWHQTKPKPRNVSFHSERISFCLGSAVYDPTIQLNKTTCFWIKNKSNKKKATLNFLRLSWPLTGNVLLFNLLNISWLFLFFDLKRILSFFLASNSVWQRNVVKQY